MVVFVVEFASGCCMCVWFCGAGAGVSSRGSGCCSVVGVCCCDGVSSVCDCVGCDGICVGSECCVGCDDWCSVCCELSSMSSSISAIKLSLICCGLMIGSVGGVSVIIGD